MLAKGFHGFFESAGIQHVVFGLGTEIAVIPENKHTDFILVHLDKILAGERQRQD